MKVAPKALVTIGALLLVLIVSFSKWQAIDDKQRASRVRAASVACKSRLKQITLSAMLWANDHGEMRLSTNFAVIRNRTDGPKLFICPGDSSNPMRQVTSWKNFDFKFSSYEALPGVKDGDGSTPFVRCKYHGYIAYGDSRVAEQNDDVKSR